jgi:hypothetical protein
MHSAGLDTSHGNTTLSAMNIKRILFLCFMPVFVALAFLGAPPPVMHSLKSEQQEQGETLKENK